MHTSRCNWIFNRPCARSCSLHVAQSHLNSCYHWCAKFRREGWYPMLRQRLRAKQHSRKGARSPLSSPPEVRAANARLRLISPGPARMSQCWLRPVLANYVGHPP